MREQVRQAHVLGDVSSAPTRSPEISAEVGIARREEDDQGGLAAQLPAELEAAVDVGAQADVDDRELAGAGERARGGRSPKARPRSRREGVGKFCRMVGSSRPAMPASRFCHLSSPLRLKPALLDAAPGARNEAAHSQTWAQRRGKDGRQGGTGDGFADRRHGDGARAFLGGLRRRWRCRSRSPLSANAQAAALNDAKTGELLLRTGVNGDYTSLPRSPPRPPSPGDGRSTKVTQRFTTPIRAHRGRYCPFPKGRRRSPEIRTAPRHRGPDPGVGERAHVAKGRRGRKARYRAAAPQPFTNSVRTSSPRGRGRSSNSRLGFENGEFSLRFRSPWRRGAPMARCRSPAARIRPPRGAKDSAW